MVKSGGQVKYMFRFNAGAAILPAGSTLALSTITGPPPIFPKCTTTKLVSGEPTNFTLTPGVGAPSAAITELDAELRAANEVWDCEFLVSVTESHKMAGKIAGFQVKLVFGGLAALTKAFYVPQLPMPEVYVYTGGTLAVDPVTAVDVTGDEGLHYHESE